MTLSSITSSTLYDTEKALLPILLMKLTKREWDVILHFSKGLSTSQIAEEICIEPKSVENYRMRIANKLELKGRNKLVWFSWKNQELLEGWYKFLREN